MEYIKKHWKDILLVVLVLFSFTKCTQSCNRAGQYDDLKQHTDTVIAQSAEKVAMLQDSIRGLETQIKIYEERVSGMKSAMSIQDEAARRISEAKKNISVKVNK